MIDGSRRIEERLTWFSHDHFPMSAPKVMFPYPRYVQHLTFRSHASTPKRRERNIRCGENNDTDDNRRLHVEARIDKHDIPRTPTSNVPRVGSPTARAMFVLDTATDSATEQFVMAMKFRTEWSIEWTLPAWSPARVRGPDSSTRT